MLFFSNMNIGSVLVDSLAPSLNIFIQPNAFYVIFFKDEYWIRLDVLVESSATSLNIFIQLLRIRRIMCYALITPRPIDRIMDFGLIPIERPNRELVIIANMRRGKDSYIRIPITWENLLCVFLYGNLFRLGRVRMSLYEELFEDHFPIMGLYDFLSVIVLISSNNAFFVYVNSLSLVRSTGSRDKASELLKLDNCRKLLETTR